VFGFQLGGLSAFGLETGFSFFGVVGFRGLLGFRGVVLKTHKLKTGFTTEGTEDTEP
jgi:hypothetical protein